MAEARDTRYFLYLTCPDLAYKSTLTPGQTHNIKHTYFTQVADVAKTFHYTYYLYSYIGIIIINTVQSFSYYTLRVK